MKFFRDRLPASDLSSLGDHLGHKPTVLAWAQAQDGPAVALPDRLALRHGDTWSDVPWDDILSGGWNEEERSLHWRRVSTSERVELPLPEPGSLPEVFRERVEATILVTRVVHAGAGRAITLTGRRPLGGRATGIRWTAHPAPGVRMEGETLVFVERELARLRAEYAF